MARLMLFVFGLIVLELLFPVVVCLLARGIMNMSLNYWQK